MKDCIYGKVKNCYAICGHPEVSAWPTCTLERGDECLLRISQEEADRRGIGYFLHSDNQIFYEEEEDEDRGEYNPGKEVA